MRATSSGYIGFGAVQVPVRMYKATDETKSPFHVRHATDLGRMTKPQICGVCGEKLTTENTVKAIEQDDKLLTFTREEVDALDAEETKFIKLCGFCKREEVEDIGLTESHFVSTANKKDGGFQAFHLLHSAMIKAGLVAILQWSSDGKKRLGILMPYRRIFVLKRQLYANETRNADEVEVEPAQVDTMLVDKAMKLIGKMKVKFDITQYVNEKSEGLNSLIDARLMGGELAPKTAVVKPQSSLADALDASL